MHKERLFEYIRNEEVVIWAGAGMSLYAGYPSGQKLADIFYESLTKEEASLIPKNLSLLNLTEDIYRIRGSKNSIYKLLEKEFVDFIPSSIEHHEKLATIPHFKTIITTNYDLLFEKTIVNKSVVNKPEDISYLSPQKTHIIKIHGDLSNKNDLIITQTDYNNFFKKNSSSNILWTHIKNIIATKNILFLGYGYEDSNISVIFDQVLDELGDHRKEIFFVAPNQPKHKINHLEKKNIHYIDCYGENLIVELIENLKENIIDDFQNKKVSVETFRSFLNEYDLTPNLKGERNSYTLTSLEGLSNDKILGNFKLTIQYNEELFKEFNSFIQGKIFGELEIPKEQISNLLITSNGIKITSQNEIEKFSFKSRPLYSGKFDIKFVDGLEIFDLDYKIYGSSNRVEIHINFKSIDLTILYTPSNENSETIPLNFKYTHQELFRRTSEEIEILTFIEKLFSNVEFNIFKDDIIVFTKSIFLPEISNEVETSLDFFKKLKIIEDYYKIRFANLKTSMITDEIFDQVDLISSIIKNGEKIYDKSFTLNFDADYEKIQQEVEEINNGTPVEVEHNTPEEIDIFGQKIYLGYKKISFLNPKIVNLEKLKNKTNQTVTVNSKKIKITYNSNAKPT